MPAQRTTAFVNATVIPMDRDSTLERQTVVVRNGRDLRLLDANPLVSVANAQRRAGLMVNGRWLPEAEIQRGLAALAAGYAAP